MMMFEKNVRKKLKDLKKTTNFNNLLILYKMI